MSGRKKEYPYHPMKQAPLEERRKIMSRIVAKYPGTVPVILCPGKGIFLSKTKFVIPSHTKVSTLILHTRDQIQELGPSEAIFLFVGDSISPPVTTYMDELYERYKDCEDGFLYVHVAKENTFG